MDEHSTLGQKGEMAEVLNLYEHIFSSSSFDLGTTSLTQHRIELTDEKPVREPNRKQPVYIRESIQKEIDSLEKHGIIQRSDSPWRQQIVPVKKTDGSWRICVDYRRLNEQTIKDAYPMPRIEENIDTLSGSKWFSSLDLTMGYHQVDVNPADRQKTAFSSPSGGLYEYTKMPFGLCNAPGTFERLMERVLLKLQWHVAVLYLDDIIVYGKDWKEHLRNLELVFQRISGAGLKLKPKKCKLARKRVKFLGHIVSEGGVEVNPEKVEAVQH